MCTDDLETLIENVYGSVANHLPVLPPDYFLHHSILSAQNADVDEVNLCIIRLFPGPEEVLLSADSVVHRDNAEVNTTHQYPMEYLRSLQPAGLLPGDLCLKHGCPIILMQNLAPRRRLCNGTRLIFVNVGEQVLEARIIGGKHDGKLAFIPCLTLSPSNSNTKFSFKLNQCQFPVRLAFSISINKAQGQLVKYIGLDFCSPVFVHGQLYVALSRAMLPHKIHVLLPTDANN
jgi:hypothetical protein